jgi:hypothetical protein
MVRWNFSPSAIGFFDRLEVRLSSNFSCDRAIDLGSGEIQGGADSERMRLSQREQAGIRRSLTSSGPDFVRVRLRQGLTSSGSDFVRV